MIVDFLGKNKGGRKVRVKASGSGSGEFGIQSVIFPIMHRKDLQRPPFIDLVLGRLEVEGRDKTRAEKI